LKERKVSVSEMKYLLKKVSVFPQMMMMMMM